MTASGFIGNNPVERTPVHRTLISPCHGVIPRAYLRSLLILTMIDAGRARAIYRATIERRHRAVTDLSYPHRDDSLQSLRRNFSCE